MRRFVGFGNIKFVILDVALNHARPGIAESLSERLHKAISVLDWHTALSIHRDCGLDNGTLWRWQWLLA
jgi:hypothetical protein